MIRAMTDIIVVGGGASGLIAAGFAAQRGFTTTLIERGRFVGRKLGLTGKGRCNLTNNTTPDGVIANVPTNGKFLYSAINGFTPADTMRFFESLGVPLKTERGGRVFPVSDRAADIVNALRTFCKKNGVRIVHNRVTNVKTSDNRATGVVTEDGDFDANSVILATGGLSYPATGSTGDGFLIAQRLGHTVNTPRASLVPLEEDGNICSAMQGLMLKNVRLTVYNSDNRRVFENQGELLFTHFGVSGPLTLSASACMRDFENTKYRFSIDLKPALDEKKLDERIQRDFRKYANHDFSNALGDLAGRLMIPKLVELSGIPPNTKVNAITRAQRLNLVRLFKSFPVKIKGSRPIDEAIITSGGVEPREINPKTMESKIISNLYFAGEIIDVDAYTGGFNLQIAWSTGYKAGINAGNYT